MRRNKPLRAKEWCRACFSSICSCGKPPSLAPGKPMARKPIAPVNRKRKAERFRENFHSSEFVKWIHGFPCALCEAYGWTEAAHVKRRSQGGRVEENVVPLCGDRAGIAGCHGQFDRYELEDERMRLRALAKELWAAWESRVEP